MPCYNRGMKHCIIVKFKDHEHWRDQIPAITAHFAPATDIAGVSGVQVRVSNSTRENRYHLMIELTMTADALPLWDKCDIHHKWKEQWGEQLESKTIFDYDE